MSNYDELWKALTLDAADGLLVAGLKEWLGDVTARLNAHNYPMHEDLDHDSKLEECLLFILRDCMTAERWDEFMGSDKPTEPDIFACPQCDDEEYMVELEDDRAYEPLTQDRIDSLNDALEKETISIDRKTLERLVETVLKVYVESLND